MLEKNSWIKQLQVDDRVEDMFVVAELRSGPTQTGNQPLKFNLRDATGIMWAHIWCNTQSEYQELYQMISRAYEEEKVVLVQGVVKAYRGEKELEVKEIKILQEGEFQDFATIDSLEPEQVERLMQDLRKIIDKRLGEWPGPDARFAEKLIQAFFQDGEFIRDFTTAPAARFYHHAKRGGLLEHTYNVVRLATGTAVLFNKTYGTPVSVPLVLAGALFHDIGKIKSYHVGRRDIRETYQGQVVGHIFLGMSMVEQRAKQTFSPQELDRLPALLHIIASHHGHHEFGAPVEPRFPEAFVVYHADDLDAKLEHMARSVDQELPAYSVMLKRVLFEPQAWRENTD